MDRRMTGAARNRSTDRIDVTDVPAEQVQAYARADRRDRDDLFLERRGTRTYLVTGTTR